MRLGLSAILKGVVPRRRPQQQQRKLEETEIRAADHAYVKGHTTHRGPCPGLNALANHGFLPRDGEGVTLPRLEAALVTALQMSGPLAHALAHALRPLCREDGTFDLADMRRPRAPSPEVVVPVEAEARSKLFSFHDARFFQLFLADAQKETITVKSLARTHRRRKKQRRATGSPKPPLKDRVASLVQAVSVLHAAGVGGIGGKLPVEVMAVLEAEERLLEAVYRNKRKRTLMGFALKAVTLWFYILIRVRAEKA